MPELDSVEQVEALRVLGCLELLDRPDLDVALQSSCRHVLEGAAGVSERGLGWPAALLCAALALALAWWGRSFQRR